MYIVQYNAIEYYTAQYKYSTVHYSTVEGEGCKELEHLNYYTMQEESYSTDFEFACLSNVYASAVQSKNNIKTKCSPQETCQQFIHPLTAMKLNGWIHTKKYSSPKQI